MKLFTTTCMVLSLFSTGTANTKDRPNVLMISVDDLNDWIGCMGGHPSARTPNMDKLASQGILFSNAHCQVPLCGPSRASLLSGLRPSSTGIYGQIKDEDIREANAHTKQALFLPEYFKNNGYHTMGIGKIFHEHAPAGVFEESGGREKGFGPLPPNGQKFHWNKKGTQTDWGAFPNSDEEMPDYRSAQWTIERLKRKYTQPFFLTVGFIRPHVPWYVPQKWFDKNPSGSIVAPPFKSDDRNDLPAIALQIDELPMMPTTEWAIQNNEWTNMVQAYLACVSFTDHYIGEILNALEKSGYKNNTIVILWSDNGYRLGEKGTFAKHCLWSEATRVPLIISVPGMKKNRVCDQLVELLDIYPTLTDLCGLPANKTNEGKSLKSVMENGESENYAISTYGRNNHAVISENYRYIRYEDGSEELYDLKNDPNEWNNIAHDEKSIKIKEQHRRYLPVSNALWSRKSSYGVNPFFINQRLTQSDQE
ncbi:MAG: sulfatase [Prolixibacteraceae bacterium]